MTCVVGIANKKNVWMGADSCGSNSYTRGQVLHPKVFAKEVPVENAAAEHMLIGGCGSFRMLQLLEYAFCPPRINSDRDLIAYLSVEFADTVRQLFKDKGFSHIANNVEVIADDGSEFLIGFRGHLYAMQGAFQAVGWMTQEDAAGSGHAFALGSLHTTRRLKWTPERRIQSALEASAEINPHVQGPFKILKI